MFLKYKEKREKIEKGLNNGKLEIGCYKQILNFFGLAVGGSRAPFRDRKIKTSLLDNWQR